MLIHKCRYPNLYIPSSQSITDRAGLEGFDITECAVLAHTASHIGIAGQVEVLDEKASGTFWKLQFGCRSGQFQVGFFGVAGDIVSEYHLLVPHFRYSTGHLILSSLSLS